MGPRLILSNAQKSAGTHAPISVGHIPGSRDKLRLLRKAAMQRELPVTTGRLLEVELLKLTFRLATARVDSLTVRVRPAPTVTPNRDIY